MWRWRVACFGMAQSPDCWEEPEQGQARGGIRGPDEKVEGKSAHAGAGNLSSLGNFPHRVCINIPQGGGPNLGKCLSAPIPFHSRVWYLVHYSSHRAKPPLPLRSLLSSFQSPPGLGLGVVWGLDSAWSRRSSSPSQAPETLADITTK